MFASTCRILAASKSSSSKHLLKFTSSSALPLSPEIPVREAEPWHLASAVCVERIPTLTPKLSPLQESMLNMLTKLELEESKKCDHELRIEKDMNESETKAQSLGKMKTVALNTAADDEELWAKEAAKFIPASRLTDADETADRRSVLRARDRPLHLLVDRNIGGANFWDLPTAVRRDGESMRDAACRAVVEHCGDALDFSVLGNAPFAHYVLRYSRRVREATGRRGEKVFVFKAVYRGGRVGVDPERARDHVWALREELFDIVDATTAKALAKILFDDQP